MKSETADIILGSLGIVGGVLTAGAFIGLRNLHLALHTDIAEVHTAESIFDKPEEPGKEDK